MAMDWMNECNGCHHPMDYDFNYQDMLIMPDWFFEKIIRDLSTCPECCCELRSHRAEFRIKTITASVCKDLVMPLECPLQDRIVALAQSNQR